MKDMIRDYFMQMLEDDIDLESALDNLMDLVVEIKGEIESESE